jgi:hypothetical protein
MSHTSKIKDPKKTDINTLSPDEDSLISEYKKLDAMLAILNKGINTENEKIVKAQQTINEHRAQGLQMVGQANVIGRILLDMGFDVKTLAPPPEMPKLVEPTPPLDALPESEEEVPAKRGLRNRFSPR